MKQQITDENKTSYEYNVFGRGTNVTNRDGTWTASIYDKVGHLLYESYFED
ncbi:hypothetical protein [Treponema bryantii]|uniref:hypothetical protein n=1 Tax=Treponema bryantii TaxID=163 RepID=UPI002B2FB5E9|nr:hypothetical protein TRBR_13200 [Treponema bryantii]